MLTYDNALYENGYRYIAGVDEAGRGPLAGPVVAAAVILNPDITICGINDSKKLSESRREKLYKEIQSFATAWSVGIVSHEIIDRINILQASLEAMKLAILKLPTEPNLIIIDGKYLPNINLPMKALPKGDTLSQSIAAASIMAKVTRDDIMRQLDNIYPNYGFAKNKGYPTVQHLAALNKFGPCEIHRKTFSPVVQRVFQLEIKKKE